MSLVKSLRVVIVAISLTVISIVYLFNRNEMEKLRLYSTLQTYQQFFHQQESHVTELIQEGYLVWNPRCKMLNIDPWDKSIRPYLNPIKSVVCSKIPPLTYTETRKNVGNVLKVDEGVVGRYKHQRSSRIDCCYSVIVRISQNFSHYNSDADNKYSLSDCKNFKKETVLSNSTEFIYVKCHSVGKDPKKSKEVYKNVHAVVPLLPRVLKRLEIVQQKEEISRLIASFQTPETNEINPATTIPEKPKKLSVMIIGIDSVSRLNLRRTMPNTLDYLQRNDWIELNGYNKIADNTFPNLMAILSGEDYSTLYRKCSVNGTRVMDLCPIMWKEFREKGYVTAYAEDVPSIGTFNYLQTGFVEQPTDFYMRPFMLAAHKLLPNRNRDSLPICVGPVSAVDHILNYAKGFSETFSNYNYFGLFWLNSFSHNNVNLPAALDFRLINFLKDLSHLKTYENTMVVLLSDHGMRFGSIRNTFVGYYEERLPFIFIWVPKWFRRKYPNKYANLMINRNRLTSPYDVHVTLKRILDEDYRDNISSPISKACPTCVSLFERVPWNRGCEDAGIEPQWCMCPNFKKLNVADSSAVQVGKFLFQYILNRTKELLKKDKINERLCAKRTFSKIVRSYRSISPNNGTEMMNDQNKTVSSDYYVIAIELNPGSALFEGTVQVNRTDDQENPVMKVLSPVSRLNSYYLSSKCINSKLLKFYCHCTV